MICDLGGNGEICIENVENVETVDYGGPVGHQRKML